MYTKGGQATMTKIKGTNGQTRIHKTLHLKLQIEQLEPHQKLGVNSGALEELEVHVPHVSPVVLLL